MSQRNRTDHEHKHLDEIQKLSYISTRQHLSENALVQIFLKCESRDPNPFISHLHSFSADGV